MKLLSLIRSLDAGAERGALVSIRSLRDAAVASGVTVDALDAAVLHNARWGNVSLHATDWPAERTAAELSRDYLYVPDADASACGEHARGIYVLGVAIRQS